jgi:hypothetical protein
MGGEVRACALAPVLYCGPPPCLGNALTAVAAMAAVLCCAVQARRWVKEAVESGKYKPRLVMPVAAAAV